MKKAMLIIIAMLIVASLAAAAVRGAAANVTISPNPMEEMTTITVFLAEDTFVNLTIQDDKDDVLYSVYSGMMRAGLNQYQWDGTGEDGERLAPGRYYVDLAQQRFTSVKRVIILK